MGRNAPSNLVAGDDFLSVYSIFSKLLECKENLEIQELRGLVVEVPARGWSGGLGRSEFLSHFLKSVGKKTKTELPERLLQILNFEQYWLIQLILSIELSILCTEL